MSYTTSTHACATCYTFGGAGDSLDILLGRSSTLSSATALDSTMIGPIALSLSEDLQHSRTTQSSAAHRMIFSLLAVMFGSASQLVVFAAGDYLNTLNVLLALWLLRRNGHRQSTL